MKGIKNKPVIIGLLVLLLCSVAGTLVYGALKKDDSVLNRLTIGHLKGELKETFDDSQELVSQVDYPKEVTVKNTGNLNLFVRVMVFPEITTDEGFSLAGTIGSEIDIDLNPKWTSGNDGYYYYLGKLSKGEITPPVFTRVTIGNNILLSQSYQDAKLTIQLKSETITAAERQYRQAWWGLTALAEPTEAAQISIDMLLGMLIDKN